LYNIYFVFITITLKVVHVRGKRGRQVPVLMETNVMRAMEQLTDFQQVLMLKTFIFLLHLREVLMSVTRKWLHD